VLLLPLCFFYPFTIATTISTSTEEFFNQGADFGTAFSLLLLPNSVLIFSLGRWNYFRVCILKFSFVCVSVLPAPHIFSFNLPFSGFPRVASVRMGVAD
jgi:hypothetical protein